MVEWPEWQSLYDVYKTTKSKMTFKKSSLMKESPMYRWVIKKKGKRLHKNKQGIECPVSRDLES